VPRRGPEAGVLIKLNCFNDFHGSGVNTRSWVFQQSKIIDKRRAKTSGLGVAPVLMMMAELRFSGDIEVRADKPAFSLCFKKISDSYHEKVIR